MKASTSDGHRYDIGKYATLSRRGTQQGERVNACVTVIAPTGQLLQRVLSEYSSHVSILPASV